MWGINQARARNAYGNWGRNTLGGLASSLYTAYRNFRGPIRDAGRVSRAIGLPWPGTQSRRGGSRGGGRLSAVSFKKRSSKFRSYRKKKRRFLKKRKTKKPKAPAWAVGSLSRYLARRVLIKDNGQFNINKMGDNVQNRQQYHMHWNALASNLDQWLINAYNAIGDSITNVNLNSEIFIKSVRTVLSVSCNCSMPVDLDVWMLTPRRKYDEAESSITGKNPLLITYTEPTETKTTAFYYDIVGHDPTMCTRLMQAFKLKKVKSVRLQPGDTIKLPLAGKGGLFSKERYGIHSYAGFNDHHTVMKALSQYGLLLRARGVTVHDESKVTSGATPLDGTSLNLATSGFNLDCTWERKCYYMAPIQGLSDANQGMLYRGYDENAVAYMTQANESRYTNATASETTTLA